MSEISRTLSVSLIMLSIVLSVIFAFGILQYINVGTQDQGTQQPTIQNGEVSLNLLPSPKTITGSESKVSLELLPAGG